MTMIGRPALQTRVIHQDNARFHGGLRTSPILGCCWHETDSLRWLGAGGTHAYLNSGQKKASYTYAIERDGTIYRFCPPELIAYHAGVKCTAGPLAWRRGESINGRTLGVAWITKCARGFPLTDRQLESGLWLGTILQERYGYAPTMNYGHREVAPTWKSDPMAEHLDMDHWRALLGIDAWPDVITPRSTPRAA